MHISCPDTTSRARAYVTTRYSEHAFMHFEDSPNGKGIIIKMLKESCRNTGEDFYLSVDNSMLGFRNVQSMYMKWDADRSNAAVWNVEIYQESFITFKLIEGENDRVVGGYLVALSELNTDQRAGVLGGMDGAGGVYLAVSYTLIL